MAKKKSNAKAMRECRQKMKADPEKHEAYKQSERERYQKRKQAGKLPTIKQKPESEQRRQRRTWKLEKRKQRRRKQNDTVEELPDLNTPPQSPLPGPSNENVESHQKRSGRKKMKRSDRKAYRTIDKQKEIIRRLSNKIRSKERVIHLLRSATDKNGNVISNSPASKADQLLKQGNTDEIRRELKFSFAVSEELKKKVGNTAKKRSQKNIIRNIVLGSVMKKYRLMNRTRSAFKMTERLIKSQTTSVNPFANTRKKRHSLSTIEKCVREFFLQDDVSQPTAGKKETITKHKTKKQRRYLCDSMKNLYKKFISANPSVKVSYTNFTRFRPFYVLFPSVDDRNTVKCKVHENAELKAKKLHLQGIVKFSNVNTLMESIVCDTKQEICMFGNCQVCKGSMNNIYKSTDQKNAAANQEISWLEWITVSDTRQTSKGNVNVKVTKKSMLTDTVVNLCSNFEIELRDLMKHSYKVYHQFEAIRKLKQNLKEDEVVLQIDFSENYCAKAATEIQSMHFGGNRPQFALHTCHATYVQDGQHRSKCYCTISEDTRHNASAIWAHLAPVLRDLSKKFDIIHFISDGPTSQYKNKSNFNMAAIIPFNMGFKYVSWNFLESSHGKGPADGVGAAVKCAADRCVAHGDDILSCDKLMEVLDGKINVQLYRVTAEDVNNSVEKLESLQVEPIKQIMAVRQIIIPCVGTMGYRNLSCYCSDGCACHDRRTIQLNSVENGLIKPSTSSNDPVLAAIEKMLTEEQKALFEKRIGEGYDVVLENLDDLNDDQRKTYMLWKSWRAAKFAGENKSEANKCRKQSEIDHNEGNVSADDRETESVNSDDKNDPDWKPEIILKESNFYAVVFLIRNKKKVFYIGRLTEKCGKNEEVVEMKFLERQMVDGQYVYKWPRRQDICIVSKHTIIKELMFDGPPPYQMTEQKNAELESLTRSVIL